MDETNPPLHNTHGKAQRAPRAISNGGNAGNAQRAASSLLLLLTFTLEALLDQPPEQAATVVTEGGAHVVVDSEAVGHVDVEPLLLELSTATRISPQPGPLTQQGGGSATTLHPPLTQLSAAFLESFAHCLLQSFIQLQAKTGPWVVQPSISQMELSASVTKFG